MKINLQYLFIAILVFVVSNTFAQVRIGTKTPAASAALEVSSSSNNKGILIPRITATQKDAISNPAEGLMVYQTSAPAGFYYYNGSAWKLMAIQADIASKVGYTESLVSANTNVSANTAKVGITTAQAADIITNNAKVGYTDALVINKAPLASPTFTGTVSGITSTMVGLGNVDNTSDATKNAATATLTNKTLASPVINTPTGIVKRDVGLGNVDNTTDLLKPVSTDTQTALNLKANIASPTFTGTVTGPTFVGALTGNATTAGTVTTAAQPNITSVGTLGNLTVTDPIVGSITGNAATATLASTVTINANLTGDVTSSGSNVTTIDAGKVTNAMLAGSIDLTSKVTGILPSSNGGTGNGFTTITGPSSSEKTFTLPDASATILTSNAAVSVAQGGTGASTLTANNVLLGSGTGALQAVAPGISGNVLTSDGSTWTSVTPPALTTYLIGLNLALGGYVFYVTPDGKNGLVAETIDQFGTSDFPLESIYTSSQGKAIDNIANPAKHSIEGANFTDWRLPSRYEMLLMYNTIGPGATGTNQNIGNFIGDGLYLSSTVRDDYSQIGINFSSGVSVYYYLFYSSSGSKESARAVRSF